MQYFSWHDSSDSQQGDHTQNFLNIRAPCTVHFRVMCMYECRNNFTLITNEITIISNQIQLFPFCFRTLAKQEITLRIFCKASKLRCFAKNANNKCGQWKMLCGQQKTSWGKIWCTHKEFCATYQAENSKSQSNLCVFFFAQLSSQLPRIICVLCVRRRSLCGRGERTRLVQAGGGRVCSWVLNLAASQLRQRCVCVIFRPGNNGNQCCNAIVWEGKIGETPSELH